MSRHGRKVPTSFYHRFTVDTRAFADKYSQGRIVSVLEGGYSDRALCSGAMAHLCGLASTGNTNVDENWWSLENLEKVGLNYVVNLPVIRLSSTSLKKLPRNVEEEDSLLERLGLLSHGWSAHCQYSHIWKREQLSTWCKLRLHVPLLQYRRHQEPCVSARNPQVWGEVLRKVRQNAVHPRLKRERATVPKSSRRYYPSVPVLMTVHWRAQILQRRRRYPESFCA